MVERIVVDDEGIRTEGAPDGYGYPWDEIVKVGVCFLTIPPDDHLFRYLDVSHVSGDFIELTERLDGWREAVTAIVARSGRADLDLDLDTVPPDGPVEIWPARTVGG